MATFEMSGVDPRSVDCVSDDRLWEAVGDIPAGADRVRVRVQRRRLHEVVFRLVDAEGIARPNVVIFLRAGDAPHLLDGEFLTDATGTVRVHLPEGRYSSLSWRLLTGRWNGMRIDVPHPEPIEIGR